MKHFFILLLLSISAIPCYSQMTGEIRTNFITSSNEACFKVQRAGKDNGKIPDESLKQWCRCTSTYTADGLTNQLVKEMEQGKRPVSSVSQLTQLAAKYCATNSKFKSY